MVAAGLWLASGLANLRHFLPFTHTLCVEHGEVVHSPLSVPRAGAVPGGRHAAVHAAAATSTPSGHEHCPLASVAYTRAAADPPAQAGPPLQSDLREVVAVPQAVRPAAIATFRIAPKQSPPA